MVRANLCLVLVLLPAMCLVGLYLNGPQFGIPWYLLLPLMAVGAAIVAVSSMVALSEVLVILERRRLRSLNAKKEGRDPGLPVAAVSPRENAAASPV